MRVNEILSRCRTDQLVQINYNTVYNMSGHLYDIIGTEEYVFNKIGDMLVIKIATIEETYGSQGTYPHSVLYMKAVK